MVRHINPARFRRGFYRRDVALPTSNQPGQSPPNGIPLTFVGQLNASHAEGFAETSGGEQRSYLSANSGSLMYLSMEDTYTVYGNATGPFSITAHLDVDGIASSVRVSNGARYWEDLVGANVTAEIGTFDHSTAAVFSEQFRVMPFDYTLNSARQSFASEAIYLGAPFSYRVDFGTSHTRTVSVGDVFELGYGVTSALTTGTLDLRNTAIISFDLPAGVYLTSALGATFGAPIPEPSTALLLASGLVALRMRGRARQRSR